MPSSSSKNLPTVLGVLAVLFWSTSIAVVRNLIESLGPLTAGAAAYLIGGVLSCLPLLVRPERARRILRLPRAYLFGCGGLVVFYTLCLFLSLGLAADRAQVVEVGLINYLWPVLTVLLAVPILGHRARIGLVPGVLIAFAGIGLVAAAQNKVLSWPGFRADLRSNAAPYLFALAAAVAWALYSDLSRRWAGAADSGAMNLFLFASGLVLLAARCFFHEHPQWSPEIAVKMAFYVVFSIGLAYPFWDIAMRRGRMVFVASFSYLLPLFSTVTSSLYLHIPLTSALWLGCALVIAGAVICKFSVVERMDDGSLRKETS
jgi:drug/metabolite transporter (DMT)-like permease